MKAHQRGSPEAVPASPPRCAKRPLPDCRSTPRTGRAKQFAALLRMAKLEQHATEAVQWWEEIGVETIEEIEEGVADMAEHLGLKPFERQGLERAVEDKKLMRLRQSKRVSIVITGANCDEFALVCNVPFGGLSQSAPNGVVVLPVDFRNAVTGENTVSSWGLFPPHRSQRCARGIRMAAETAG